MTMLRSRIGKTKLRSPLRKKRRLTRLTKIAALHETKRRSAQPRLSGDGARYGEITVGSISGKGFSPPAPPVGPRPAFLIRPA